MAQAAEKRMTVDDYLELEEKSEVKHEFIDGEMFTMAGGSVNHNQIAGNTFAGIYNRLQKKPCRVFNSDMRVQIEFFDVYTYPDVVVICGKPELMEGRHDTITNPILIVEVLSPTTRSYDKSSKFTYYRSLPSLKDYVLIDQNTFHVEYYRKIKTGEWVLADYYSVDDVVTLQSLEIELPLAEIYRLVEWETKP